MSSTHRYADSPRSFTTSPIDLLTDESYYEYSFTYWDVGDPFKVCKFPTRNDVVLPLPQVVLPPVSVDVQPVSEECPEDLDDNDLEEFEEEIGEEVQEVNYMLASVILCLRILMQLKRMQERIFVHQQIYRKSCTTQESFEYFPPFKDLTRYGVEANPGPKRNPRQTKRSKRPPNPKPIDTAQPNTSFMRGKNTVQPQSDIQWMSFSLGVQPFNNPGGPIVTENYYTNDGYDVLPGILTPTIPLINNKFALYKFCKVIRVEFEYIITNLEQFPVDVHFYSSGQSMAGIFSTRSNVDAMNTLNKNMWTTTLSEQYGKNSQVRAKINVIPWRALGDFREYMSSNDFSFTQSTNPARITHASLVLVGGGSTLGNGVMISTMLHFKFKFYDPVDLTAPLFRSLLDKTEVSSEDEVEINGIKYVKRRGQAIT